VQSGDATVAAAAAAVFLVVEADRKNALTMLTLARR
jgi:hypothetical protein